jgi:ribosomal protein L16/L10AE
MVTTRGRIVTKTKGIFHPPRQKFKKSQRAPIRRRNYSNRTLSRLGHIALKTLTPGFVNPKHFELLRRFLTRRITATTLS